MGRQGAKQKRKLKLGFQVVPAGESAMPAGQKKKKQKHSLNTLRDAHKSSQQSKADELWFRKCGHGELLFRDYYQKQAVVPARDQASFWAALGRSLPVTFRVHGHTAAGAVAARRLRELAAATSSSGAEPVWAGSSTQKAALLPDLAGDTPLWPTGDRGPTGGCADGLKAKIRVIVFHFLVA